MNEKLPAAIEMRIVNDMLNSDTQKLVPQLATPGSAAYDLRACIDQPLTLQPAAMELIGTGIALHIGDPNLVALVVPRSGLGIRHGIVLANLTGVIDSDYTGEIKIGTWNRGGEPYTIEPLARLCQLMFVPVHHPQLRIVDEFSQPSKRGTAGFGSTGSG